MSAMLDYILMMSHSKFDAQHVGGGITCILAHSLHLLVASSSTVESGSIQRRMSTVMVRLVAYLSILAFERRGNNLT